MFEDGEGEGEGDTEVLVEDVEAEEDDVADETPEKPDAGAPAGEGAPADVLLTFSESEWAKELLEDQETKGAAYTVTQADIDALPLEAKRVLSALMFHGKRAEAAQAENLGKATKAETEAKAAERRAVAAQAEALSWTQAPGLKEYLEKLAPKGDQPDPSSPEGVAYAVNKALHSELSKFFGALNGVTEKRKADQVELEAKAAHQAQVDAAAAYMEKYPDDFADESVSLKRITELYKRAKGGLTVEEAHQAVMAQMTTEELERSNADGLKLARERVHKGGTRGKPIPVLPKEIRGNTELETQWYDEHPDAMQRDIELLLKQGAL